MIKKYIYDGEVINNSDDNDSGLIYVRIPEIDQNISNEKLPPCLPLHNYSFFRVKPKKGERVKIIFERDFGSDIRLNQEKRYWTNVVISDVRNINYDPFYFSSNSNEPNGWITKTYPLTQEVNMNGLLLSDNDIQLRGRNNTDILFRDNEILIRAGRHLNNNTTSYNNVDPAYLQFKFKKESFIEQTENNNFEYVDEFIPSKFFILLTVNALSTLIKVVDIQTLDIIETYSKTYENINELNSDTKTKLLFFQEKYPEWEFKTQSETFINLPKVFNNIIRVKKEIINTNKSNQNPSVVNVVASKINLLTHKSNFNLTTPNKEIDETTQAIINEQAQRLPMGENLLDLLILMRDIILNHQHPYAGMSAVNDILMQKLRNYNLEGILNEDIRLS